MAKAVKLADIAEKVGVSCVTVSKALSGQKGVSEEMRKKIMELAEQMGYKQPSVIRKENPSRKNFQIGVLIQEGYLTKYDSFYWLMYQKVSTQALSINCFTQLEVVSAETEKNKVQPRLLIESYIDGLLIVGKLSNEYLEMLKSVFNKPIVYIDFSDGSYKSDAVVFDSYYGGYQLTNYLLTEGHKKIGFVGTVKATPSITDRYFGYTKALMEHNIPISDEWQIDDRKDGNGMIAEELFRLPADMPTAFFCNCDITAAKFIEYLNGAGYRVPEDVSVVGFDNYLHPGSAGVAITTFEVDLDTMAKKGLSLLMRKMNNLPTTSGIHVVEGNLVIKDSVKSI